jgi:proteasome lid subunit RPN8/RPN11
MSPEEIQLPRKLTNQLLHLAQLSPDLEICGLISSKNGRASRCYPIRNCAEFPQKYFLLDSKEQILAMTEMRNLGEDFFAIYHSHPTAPALPSDKDLELDAYPEVIHLIISLNTKGILEMRGFKISKKSAVELLLKMND